MVFADYQERNTTMSHYHHLSTIERESILRMQGEGKSLRAMSRVLGRSASTISRELRRNGGEGKNYSPSEAERRYDRRRKRCHKKTVFSNAAAKALVQHLFLDEQWSPEQIANRLRTENNLIQVSFSTIYRGIYSGVLERTKLSKGQRGMARKLRHHGKTRHKKGEQETRGKIRISNPIELRPEEANNRSVIGHWEGDTVAGKTGSSCLITLTDRHSRYLLAKKVQKKPAAFVRDGLIELLRTIPSAYVLSVTPDRGKEFSFHEQVTDAMNGMPFYFPKPHAPWERGTNENTNGLIREYCPKSVDMENFGEGQIASFIAKLNRRPRKCLGWKSPFEVFFNTLLHLT